MAYLELHATDALKRQLMLGDSMSFGRNEDNDVILTDTGVSRHHARITRRGERFLLEDLSSSNGTFLRKQRLEAGRPSELSEGDEIQIGANRLVFHLYRFVSASKAASRAINVWSTNIAQAVA
jgi:pSer/pThr/pTyr-binding forkhead associated (FHA) protein